MTKNNRISIKQYEQAADAKVSLDGIKWLRKWDVCVQCDSAEEAEALRARLSQPEPQREWVGLTDEELHALHFELKVQTMGGINTLSMYRILEKALKEKNT